MLDHHLVDERQPETHARLLGGEEGVEDVVSLLGRNARALVAHLEYDALRRGVRPVHAEAHLAAGRTHLDRVQEQVERDLLQLIRIGPDRGQVGLEMRDQLDLALPRRRRHEVDDRDEGLLHDYLAPFRLG